MKIELSPVRCEEKEILRNLLEKYLYEFSQYDGLEINALGLHGYPYLDYYWTEENRWAFFIKADGKLAGFAMVNDIPEAPGTHTDYAMAEFFVTYQYRGSGIGRYAAFSLFDRFPGRWQLKRHPKNTAAVRFWDRVVSTYTHGDYQLEEGYPGSEYRDGTPGDVFFFQTGQE